MGMFLCCVFAQDISQLVSLTTLKGKLYGAKSPFWNNGLPLLYLFFHIQMINKYKTKHLWRTFNSNSVFSMRQQGILLFNDSLSHFMTISKVSSTTCSILSRPPVWSSPVMDSWPRNEMQFAMLCKQSTRSSKLQRDLETSLKISKQVLKRRRTSSFKASRSPLLEDLYKLPTQWRWVIHVINNTDLWLVLLS